MNSLRIASALVAAVSLSLGAGCGPADAPQSSMAQALEVQTCLDAIEALEATTEAATIKEDKEPIALLQKLEQAEEKFEAEKVAQGLQKLEEFESRVESLLEQGKIDDATAQALLAGVETAEAACAP